jgi:alpha-tubulin suppressor-like RCC1 family protein
MGGARQISGSHEHVCARTDSGVWCWGRGWEGQLGNGVPAPSGIPVMAIADPTVVDIDTGFVTSAMALSGALVAGWGYNSAEGFLGLGAAVDDVVVPTRLPLVGVAGIGLGHTHGCIVTDMGALRCFGANDAGQLGLGTMSAAVPTPTDATGLGGIRVASVDGGFIHTCALAEGGGLWCTGGNLDGSLGLGDRTNRATFERVGGGPYRALAMGARGTHTCALTTSDEMLCWGRNATRQIAGLADASIELPFRIDLGPVVAIGAGSRHTCAITLGGALYCWGDNAEGQVDAGVASVLPADIVRVCAP